MCTWHHLRKKQRTLIYTRGCAVLLSKNTCARNCYVCLNIHDDLNNHKWMRLRVYYSYMYLLVKRIGAGVKIGITSTRDAVQRGAIATQKYCSTRRWLLVFGCRLVISRQLRCDRSRSLRIFISLIYIGGHLRQVSTEFFQSILLHQMS